MNLQQKFAIDFVTQKSSMKIYDQPVNMQIFNKKLQMIWWLIKPLSEFAIILFTYRYFSNIKDWLNHLQKIFFHDLYSLKND